MTDFEHYVDCTLRAIDRLPRARQAMLRSTRLMTLEGSLSGDRITITLNDAEKRPLRTICGSIIIPGQSLIEVGEAPDLPEIVGKNLFLSAARLAEGDYAGPLYETHLNKIAGDQGFAYYTPQDTYDDRYGREVNVADNVTHLPFTYAKVSVNDRPLIDFTDQAA